MHSSTVTCCLVLSIHLLLVLSSSFVKLNFAGSTAAFSTAPIISLSCMQHRVELIREQLHKQNLGMHMNYDEGSIHTPATGSIGNPPRLGWRESSAQGFSLASHDISSFFASDRAPIYKRRYLAVNLAESLCPNSRSPRSPLLKHKKDLASPFCSLLSSVLCCQSIGLLFQQGPAFSFFQALMCGHSVWKHHGEFLNSKNISTSQY